MLSRDEAREVIKRALARSKADDCFVSIEATDGGHLRYARSEVTTSGLTSDVTVTITSAFGKRSGAAVVNQIDDASLERAVRRSEQIARLSPEDPERMPPIGPQEHAAVDAFDEAAAPAAADRRAALARQAIALAEAKGVIGAGFLYDIARANAVGDSAGLFGYFPRTALMVSTTARTPDGTGSGWGGRAANRLAGFEALDAARVAVDKGVRSARPRELAPGTYTVVLEPQAVADLMLFFMFALNARTADEGRSFFALPGGKNQIGRRVISEMVSIWSDPADPRAPSAPFALPGDPRSQLSQLLQPDTSGLPVRRTSWIENGVLRNLTYSRYWAARQEKEVVPSPVNLIMKGGSGSVDDLVRGTRRGVLVTRFFYIRSVDPQTILLTGLTRDGTFYIENGRVRHPVKNFRWNDSPVAVLSSVEAMSREVRTRGSDNETLPMVCPAIRSRINFTSLSDAI